MSNIKLPFGLNANNVLVHISDVERGKACGCICPSCQSPLIAAKGNKRQHHFKHDADCDCESGLESAIHLAAKQIIMERKQITLSEYTPIVLEHDSRQKEYILEDKAVVQNNTVIVFDAVQEEADIHGFKADLLATKGHKQLVIEIFYRHKVEDEKLDKIAKANISAIEIDLSDLTPEDVKDWETFWLFISDPERVQWLYNAKGHSIEQKLKEKLSKKIHAQEKKYKNAEVEKKRREKIEKLRLVKALEELELLRDGKHIAQLSKEAQSHPAWMHTSQYLPFSWQELPEYLNVDIPDGDWIFGCDQRVWQTSFYSYFICKNGKAFTTRAVDKWMQETVGCLTPEAAKIAGIFGRKYVRHIPDSFQGSLPSSWQVLRTYFNHLEKLGMLEYTGPDWKYPGSVWFQVISKTPTRSPPQIPMPNDADALFYNVPAISSF